MTIRINANDLRRLQQAIERWKHERQDEELVELARLQLLYLPLSEVKP